MMVYQAIGKVSAIMSQHGISKGRSNQQQGYKFRGIDDVLNALSAALVSAGLVILPRCTERVVIERQTAKGGAIFNVTCHVEFDLVSTEDGSKHTVATYGEAMDSADKATNKAMSAAYKYLALLVFCIPTEASPDTDADYNTHEVAPTAVGMSPTNVADWTSAISAATGDELEDLIKDGLAAATEVRDREAFVVIRDAGKRRRAALEVAP
jgi:ERF superfamily